MACSQSKKKSKSLIFFLNSHFGFIFINLFAARSYLWHRGFSPVVMLGLSSCNVGLVSLSETGDQTGALLHSSWIINYWTTREVPESIIIKYDFIWRSCGGVLWQAEKVLFNFWFDEFFYHKKESVVKCFFLYQLMWSCIFVCLYSLPCWHGFVALICFCVLNQTCLLWKISLGTWS